MNQSNQPLVSVVIPCYNHENFVQDSIQSVIDQTYQNIELIIIDDGSKDGSVEKIQEMIPVCQERFTRFEFRHRPNKGLSATLNEALEWCKGKYYSAIASDDLMCTEKTKIQVSYLESDEECVAVFGGVKLINEHNKIVGQRLGDSKAYSFNEIILNQHDLPASTQMARLDIIKNLGGYDENIKIEDWYLLLKMTYKKDYKILYLNKYMCLYRYHEKNFSKNMRVMRKEMILILEEYKDYRLFKQALHRIYRLEFHHYKVNKDYKNAFFVLLELIRFKFMGNGKL